MSQINNARARASHNFDEARGRAKRKSSVLSRLIGVEKDDRLLSFEQFRAELRIQSPLYRGVHEIELDKIVGSIGRYDEFTRDFLPLSDSLRERWIGVESLAETRGWPPVEVYQVGNVYFIRDGNHRTAVARQLGINTVEAHVWQFPEEIAIDPQASLDTLLIQFGERRFMSQTQLDTLFPNHDIRFTAPGRYNELLAQMERLRKKLTIIDKEEKTFEEIVPLWYELRYLPTTQIIEESTLLDDFPGRTEADLYVWLSKHRDELGELYGPYDNLADLAQILTATYKEKPLNKVTRQVRNLLGAEELPPLVETVLVETEED